MAGVGLELKNLLRKRSYFDLLKAFGYAMALSGGPWLSTVITVALISLMGLKTSPLSDMTLLTSTIMYVFAGTLILMGPLFMMFSRYLADQSFLGKRDQIGALMAVEVVVLPVAWLASRILVPYFLPLSMPHPFLYHAMTQLLFVSLCGIWALMTYMDYQKRFAYPFHVFVIGSLISLGLSFLLLSRYSVTGLLMGYAVGNTLIFLGLLFGAVGPATQRKAILSFEPAWVFGSFGKFLALGWVGFFYNLGIWVDKFVIWYMVGTPVGDGAAMRIYNPYDVPTFLSYPIMIPAMAYFLVLVETAFYGDYRSYLASLENEPLEVMEEHRTAMLKTLKHQLRNLLEFEAVLALAAFFLIPLGLKKLGVTPESIAIFHILIWASALQVLFWVQLILLLYFEYRAEALALALFFCATNALFTAATVHWQWTHGWGYFASTLVSLVLARVVFKTRFHNLHRHIFQIHSRVPTKPTAPSESPAA